ncbi:MAG: EAL domain-containing protein [Eubacteriales bacterium]
MALVYVLSDVYSEPEHKKVVKRLIGLLVCQSIIVCMLPMYIYTDETQLYIYGPSTLAVYAFVAIYIIATVIVSVKHRKEMNPRRCFASLLWMAIWLGSALIQFFNSALLVVGFASALGMLVLFVIMENPEANLERKLGCFNSYALSEYVNLLYDRKQIFSALEICLCKPEYLEKYGLSTNETFRKILQIVPNDIKSFKNINLSLVLIGETAQELQETAGAISNAFSEVEEFGKSTLFVLAPDTSSFADADELVRFLQFMQEKHKDEKEAVICSNEEMIEEFKSRHVIEQQITEALLENRVEVFLQPIYCNSENKFTSAEALVRIRQKDGTLLSPALFIPVAESTGQILEIGEKVFEEVCKFLSNTALTDLGVHCIEINLSVVQCEEKNLAERLISIIEKYKVNPKMINLEITETGSVRTQKILLENMRKLREYGFEFSLDDFGKGESNLMYLVEMPVSIVKLDYDMTKSYFNSAKAEQVVKTVFSMAHSMDMKVVVEGVETAAEADTMTSEGADYIQGYHYSKPLPLIEYLQFMNRQ